MIFDQGSQVGKQHIDEKFLKNRNWTPWMQYEQNLFTLRFNENLSIRKIFSGSKSPFVVTLSYGRACIRNLQFPVYRRSDWRTTLERCRIRPWQSVDLYSFCLVERMERMGGR